jgi:hypothetical protein
MKLEQPKRPPSAYNIFYSLESIRLRRRENAFVRFHTLFASGKSQLKLNCTQAIANKWSKGREEGNEFVHFYEVIRETKVQEYCIKKELFFAGKNFNSFEQPRVHVEPCAGCEFYQTHRVLSSEIIKLLA